MNLMYHRIIDVSLSTLSLTTMVLITGCALSPQVIHIEPVISISSPIYGQGQSVQVSVNDQRQNKVLGSRGGVYNTSYISIANSLPEALQASTQQALDQLGFRNTKNDPADIEIEVILKQLEYTSIMENYLYNIVLKNTIDIVVHMGGSVHKGTYSTNHRHQYPSPPGHKKNTTIINAILVQTMQRGLKDPNLIRFITEP